MNDAKIIIKAAEDSKQQEGSKATDSLPFWAMSCAFVNFLMRINPSGQTDLLQMVPGGGRCPRHLQQWLQ